MTTGRQEIEAKFAVGQLDWLRQRALRSGGQLISDRHLERNLRFDRPDRSLTASGQVLRLRLGDRQTLTLKQAGSDPLIREELEVEIDDVDQAAELLSRLGFEQVAAYEKYREVLRLGTSLLMLDELPFGYFAEVEAESTEIVHQTSVDLGLDWDARLRESYLELFVRLKTAGHFDADEPTFAAFDGPKLHPPAHYGLPDARVPEPAADR